MFRIKFFDKKTAVFSEDGLKVLVNNTICFPFAVLSAFNFSIIYSMTSFYFEFSNACYHIMIKKDAWTLALAPKLEPSILLFSILIGWPSLVLPKD
jgi:hypothetical protein